MLMTLNALLPIILVIASGYAVARTGLITGEQWCGIERLAYYVLFPAVLFRTISTVDFSKLPALGMGASLVATLLTAAGLLLLARKPLEAVWKINGPRFTSIFQGTLRWNAMIALAIADNVVGKEGLGILAIAMVFMIPLLNIMSILVLSHYASGTAPSALKILRDLFTNPFILSIGAGILVNLSGIALPGALDSTLEIFGRASLPIGIICVGASLDLSSLRRPGVALTLGTFLRPLFLPLTAFLYTLAFGVSGPAQMIVIIACSVPAASNSYILARQMGGDAKLMAEIITLQTLTASATIPIALLIFG
ncbi:AEC family transporter [Roseibium litorale]|uniref:AEC family transporter n=1 Tax=Roseibium litorale TaxID=2803841 RepID=A0ABR9CI82_9HYPH|nr:AEC family transporter [Roseibium litorale]MBD8890080.1 AEC family transporter [Roseibium litorale]